MKKIFSVALAAALAMSMVACSNDNIENSNASTSDVSVSMGDTASGSMNQAEPGNTSDISDVSTGDVSTGDTSDVSTGDTSDASTSDISDVSTGDVSTGDTSESGDVSTGDVSTGDTSESGDVVERPEVTLSESLVAIFQNEASAGSSTEKIVEAMLQSEHIQFAGASMTVEPGYLNGFDAEITGFESATMFGPSIGTIPFIGYIFELADGADVTAFEKSLTDNANLRWNICTAADEMAVSTHGNTVMFIMAPYQMTEG